MFTPPVARSKSRPHVSQRADSTPRFPIRAQLQVGAVDDPAEHEADRVADAIVRTPASGVNRAGIRPALRARPTGMAHEEEEGSLPSSASLDGQGQSLPARVRGFFERRLHYDFASVRVHHDAAAADSARSLGARAYTYGRNIVF